MQNTTLQLRQRTQSWKRGSNANTIDGFSAQRTLQTARRYSESLVKEAKAVDNTPADLNDSFNQVSTADTGEGTLQGTLSGRFFNLTTASADNDGVYETQLWRRPSEDGSVLVMNETHHGLESSEFTSTTLTLDDNGNLLELQESFVSRPRV